MKMLRELNEIIYVSGTEDGRLFCGPTTNINDLLERYEGWIGTFIFKCYPENQRMEKIYQWDDNYQEWKKFIDYKKPKRHKLKVKGE